MRKECVLSVAVSDYVDVCRAESCTAGESFEVGQSSEPLGRRRQRCRCQSRWEIILLSWLEFLRLENVSGLPNHDELLVFG